MEVWLDVRLWTKVKVYGLSVLVFVKSYVFRNAPLCCATSSRRMSRLAAPGKGVAVLTKRVSRAIVLDIDNTTSSKNYAFKT